MQPASTVVRRGQGAHAFREAFCAITVSLVAIAVIVLACSWLWQSVGAGVFAVLALAVPFSMPAVAVTVREAMEPQPACERKGPAPEGARA